MSLTMPKCYECHQEFNDFDQYTHCRDDNGDPVPVHIHDCSKDIKHEDLCMLSRVFNDQAYRWMPNAQNVRINEWLKLQIAAAEKVAARTARDGR